MPAGPRDTQQLKAIKKVQDKELDALLDKLARALEKKDKSRPRKHRIAAAQPA